MSIKKVKKSEIQTDFLCDICNKFYASASSLCNHQKKFHKNIGVVAEVVAEVVDVVSDRIDEVNIKKKRTYTCDYCNKIFNDKSNKYKHHKICKLKNNINNNTINNNINNNTTNNNTTNNNNNNNFINNNINNNNIIIKINNFGDEDLSHLTQKDITDMIKKGFSCVFDYIDKVHLNPNKPENHNIMLTNLKSGLIKIFQNYGWKMAKCNDILTNIIDKCYELTLHNYNDLKDNKQFHCKAYENWLRALNNNVDKTYNAKYPDMKIQLYNK